MSITRNDIEIMAPAGSFEALTAAIDAGADAVYFGAGNLNMRSASSVNFTINDLQRIADTCKEHNVRSYLTLNTVIYDDDMDAMKQMVEFAKESGISSIIASDWSVIEYARKIGVNIHCSTQLNISNSSALEYYAKYAEVIVLARELNLEKVTHIHNYIYNNNITAPSGNLVRIEMFIHGALCMAISGKCYLSLHEFNRSANRGACIQPCRRAYTVTEAETGYQLDIDNQYIMSPKDLCTIAFLDKIVNAGASVLKIEGRGRSPEYVKTVVECYNTALNAVFNDTYTDELIAELTKRLQSVFNRGFWDGYYLGQRLGEWSERHSSSATKRKEFLGVGTNYFSRLGVGEFIIQTGELEVGDEVLVIGPSTGVLEFTVSEIHNSKGQCQSASKGECFAIPVPSKTRRNDKLYKLVSN
ncbi:MAG: U32 family peptidase [Ignavibacteria bacterium]|nr:U32 family peptidase [Ignavibacteria bacterium]